MPFRLDGRVALITGAGSEHGIGRAIATVFARRARASALVDVDAAGAEHNAKQLQASAEAFGLAATLPTPSPSKPLSSASRPLLAL